MLEQIKNNIEQMQKLGLDHIKLSTEDEGILYTEFLDISDMALKLNVPIWLKIGGCEAIADMQEYYGERVTGLVAPMIESGFAVEKFLGAVKKVYKSNPLPKLSVNIETYQGHINVSHIVNKAGDKLDFFTIGLSDFRKSFYSMAQHEHINDEVKRTSIKLCNYIKNAGHKVAIGGGVIPATVNQMIMDYCPDYIQTRNFCFDVMRDNAFFEGFSKGNKVGESVYTRNHWWNKGQDAIKLALETEILMLKHFGGFNADERIEELKARLSMPLIYSKELASVIKKIKNEIE